MKLISKVSKYCTYDCLHKASSCLLHTHLSYNLFSTWSKYLETHIYFSQQGLKDLILQQGWMHQGQGSIPLQYFKDTTNYTSDFILKLNALPKRIAACYLIQVQVFAHLPPKYETCLEKSIKK